MPPETPAIALPAPTRPLAVEGISVAPPGAPRLVVQDLSLALVAGQGLGIIGASASGKSSLARALVGVWQPLRGTVRIDGAALGQWPAEDLGRHVGYLPQEVELFPGNIARNIARFDPDASPERVIAAATAAGVHEMVLRLPEGYGTPIGEGGSGLSAGQRQRVGLARALYGNPFLVVLDEPNANLDGEGESALTQAMLGVRARGGIVVVVAHRPSALAAVDTTPAGVTAPQAVTRALTELASMIQGDVSAAQVAGFYASLTVQARTVVYDLGARPRLAWQVEVFTTPTPADFDPDAPSPVFTHTDVTFYVAANETLTNRVNVTGAFSSSCRLHGSGQITVEIR